MMPSRASPLFFNLPFLPQNGADGETRTLVGQCPAVYETAAVATEPHRRNGGSPRCCPVLCGLRDRCIAAMLATRTRREGGVEPPQPGLRSPRRHRDFASREMVRAAGNAPAYTCSRSKRLTFRLRSVDGHEG